MSGGGGKRDRQKIVSGGGTLVVWDGGLEERFARVCVCVCVRALACVYDACVYKWCGGALCKR